jgi:hypothetical protein
VIIAQCPGCGTQLSIPNRLAGHAAAHPACGQRFRSLLLGLVSEREPLRMTTAAPLAVSAMPDPRPRWAAKPWECEA